MLRLQNGSDIRGVAVAGVEGEDVNLTDERVAAIGHAFAQWLVARGDNKDTAVSVAVGHDPRVSAASVKSSVFRGLAAAGACVVDVGLASTPAMFMSTIAPGHAYTGAIMLTASHLPWNRNGLKFFTAEGGLDKSDIKAILERAEKVVGQVSTFEAPQPAPPVVDFMPVYSASLCDIIRRDTGCATPLQGFRIIVDAGNGSGGFFVPQVLQALGADTTGSQFLQPDGMFPNHVANPEDSDAMAATVTAVLRHKADLGICFDTDVDRAAVVDASGKDISRDRLIALLATIVLEEHPGTTIVTDSVTSGHLTTFIEKRLGGRHHRFKRGYKNVIKEGMRLNDEGQETHLMIETSGHGAMKENRFLDDGAYLVVKTLVKMANLRAQGSGNTIASLIQDLKEPAEDRAVRLRILADDFASTGHKVIDALTAFTQARPGWEQEHSFEGVRVCVAGAGWLLLRLSLHDPVLPLNLQSDTPGGVDVMLAGLREFFANLPAGEVAADSL